VQLFCKNTFTQESPSKPFAWNLVSALVPYHKIIFGSATV